MIEELLVCMAMAAWAGYVFIVDESVLEAPASADRVVSADHAFAGEVTFLLGEPTLGFALHQFTDRCIADIAKFVFGIYEKIAAKCVPIMFDYHVITAFIAECAFNVSSFYKVCQDRIE